MRLLIATPLYPPESGGPATYTALLERYLPTHDLQVKVVPFGPVRRFPTGIRHLIYLKTILRHGRHNDLILALDPVSTGLPALLAARILRKPFVVKVVGDFAWEQGTQRFGITAPLDKFVHQKLVSLPVTLLRAVQTHVAKSARAVIVPSAYLKGIVSAWGVPADKIHIIHNAIELPSEFSSSVMLSPSTIVTAGRLVPWKGVRELIEALPLVRAQIPMASLTVIGDGPERHALEARSQEIAPDAVQFLGAQPHDAALAVMRDASVFVLNSTYEGLSHVLIEALLLGLPIVTTRVGGNVELIVEGKNGLLVSPGDTEQLADAIIRVLGDPVYAASLGTGAKAARVQFSPTRMSATTASLLASLIL